MSVAGAAKGRFKVTCRRSVDNGEMIDFGYCIVARCPFKAEKVRESDKNSEVVQVMHDSRHTPDPCRRLPSKLQHRFAPMPSNRLIAKVSDALAYLNTLSGGTGSG